MKKIISTVFVFAALCIPAFAGHVNSPGVTCAAGHVNSPGVVCTPPDPGNRITAQPNSEDDSILLGIRLFLSEYNPFGYFLN